MGPRTRYARSGDVNIAYQVIGEGPFDLVYVPGWLTNLDYGWENPLVERYYRRLASFSRLILFDKRGTGLSDRVPNAELPTLEQRMDDVRAVMDAVGSERAAVMGHSDGGNMRSLRGHVSRADDRARDLRYLRQTDSEPRLSLGSDSRGA